jgi:hypothetical protein
VGLRATTAATAVLLAAAMLVVRRARPGFDRDLVDPTRGPSPTSAPAEAQRR